MGGLEVVGVVAFIKKLVDAVRFGRGKDVNALVTQALVWVAGIVSMWITAHTDLGALIEFANVKLDDVSLAGQTFLGLLLGSVASTVKDVLKALDGTQTEAAPKLLTGSRTDIR